MTTYFNNTPNTSNTSNIINKVYNNIYVVNFNVFFCTGNIDCSINYLYLGSATTIEDARNLVFLNNQNFLIYEITHPSMDYHNNFTYLGDRNDCKKNLSFYGSGGGFIIEPFIVNKLK
jgi:hypothetical protein